MQWIMRLDDHLTTDKDTDYSKILVNPVAWNPNKIRMYKNLYQLELYMPATMHWLLLNKSILANLQQVFPKYA